MTSTHRAGLNVRRRPISAYAVIVVALGALGVLYAGLAPSGHAQTGGTDKDKIAAGNALYLQGCSSCHGLQAQGSSLAPSLVGVGAAAVDFQMGTGRMPLAVRGAQADRKPLRYTQDEIDLIASYVQSLGGGPTVPSASDTDVSNTDLALGGELFRTNCAQCHNFAGEGGELTHGKFAPSLQDTTPRHMWEAMETGPENMPVFSNRSISPDDKRNIIRYITYLRAQADPGGHGLGRIGPVSEGLVGWLFGIGVLVIATVWIGARAK